MPAMNPYAMNGYADPPSYVMPQTHLHLMDYRRMLNPHHYRTLAYHSRRLHYQHNPPGRDMISSEVQTEPLSVSQKSSGSAAATAYGGVRSRGGVHNGFPDGGHNCPERNRNGPAHTVPQASAVKTCDSLVDPNILASSIEKAPQKSSFIIQTEEVRIECCSPAVGLEVLRSCETQELALAQRYAVQDMARCSSVFTQSPVLQKVAVTAPKEQSDNGLQACPYILFVGTASCGTEGTQSLHETTTQSNLTRASPESDSTVEVCGGEAQKKTVAQGQKHNDDVSHCSNGGHFKVLHMPFDLEELQSMERTVLSMEETCIPSPDWMMQNTLIDPHLEALATEAEVATEAEAPSEKDLIDVFSEEVPMEQVVPMIEMPQSDEELLIELGSTGDAPVVAMASQSDGLASADSCVPEVASMAHTLLATGVSHSHSSELMVAPLSTADAIQHELELNDQSRHETSFESLPAYLPSAAWQSDLRNVLHCSEVPQAPQKPGRSQSTRPSDAPIRRRKLNLELHAIQRPKAEKIYKSKIKVDRRSLSDHECCLRRNQNAVTARRPRAERLCRRCLANRSSCQLVSPGLESPQSFKRISPGPLQPWLQDCVLPTCDACKVHKNKRLMCRSTCGPSCHNGAGGETSENGSCQTVPKCWRPDDPRRALTNLKIHQVSSHLPEKCPVALHPKLRERNCACDEHRVPGWEGPRRHPCGNAIQEMNQENVTVPVRYQDKWGHVEKGNYGYKWKNGE